MKTILLVEDDQWLAESYVHVLRAVGYDVTSVQSAEQAMRSIEDTMPTLLIVDILLGNQNSLALLHELQSHDDTKTIPVVVCSGVSHDELTLNNLQRYGVVAVLDKSTLTPEQMVGTVEGHIGTSS